MATRPRPGPAASRIHRRDGGGKYGFSKDEATARTLYQAQLRRPILEAISAGRETPQLDCVPQHLPDTVTHPGWRRILLAPARRQLARAEEQYGVPPQIIVAILGVETRYGANTGGYRVLMRCTPWDSTTRNAARSSASSSAISCASRARRTSRATTPTGSVCRGMGVPQFMPDSFRVCGRFDGDGRRDIWLSPDDVIGSVANYFVKKGGWKRGARWRSRCRASPVNTSIWSTQAPTKPSASELTAAGLAITPDAGGRKLSACSTSTPMTVTEYWIGLDNFYAIMRYNPRTKYAMAVYQLSEAIRELHAATAAIATAGAG